MDLHEKMKEEQDIDDVITETQVVENCLIDTILFDQDAFRDVRMLAAKRRHDSWLEAYLSELKEYSQGEVLYSRKPPPSTLGRNVNITKQDEQILKSLCISDIILLGSTQDGLYLERGFPVYKTRGSYDDVNDTDLDIVFLYRGACAVQECGIGDQFQQSGLIVKETRYPGYLKLKFPDGKKNFFSTKSLKHKLFRDLHAAKFYISENSNEIVNESPAFGGCIEDELGIHFLDYVPALRLEHWGFDKKSYRTRERYGNWPSQEVIEKVMEEGCCLVATGPPEMKEDTSLWRVSFATSEQILAHSLTDFQIRTYLIVKSIAKAELFEPECLSSYMLKNILFWALEVLPEETWIGNNIVESVEAVFDLLCSYLSMECIPNYFIPRQNLLGRAEERNIVVISSKAQRVQENAFHAILRCSNSAEFQGWCEFPLQRIHGMCLVQPQNERNNILSMLYFTVYLYIRLQSLRYQVKLTLGTLKNVIETNCRSLSRAMPRRAAWYLRQAMILNPSSFTVRNMNDTIIIDATQMRTKIVQFWRDPVYTGIFRTILDEQEFATRESISAIPEFEAFVDWVDLSCMFSNQPGLKMTDTQPIVLD
ncbi:hypothetical protein FSP39_011177 [Pinctada imbricata]|uniref:Mab-21-like nucleotidyltransferase domain-containing protein n=1 Tax=Pinctada imbricata TaxID=66713 RepID=A0AA89C1E8_PINIB|nr:hypothetical protein FSP39_011177 [Pinctada imbricata]